MYDFHCSNASEKRKNMLLKMLLTKLSDVRTAFNVETVEYVDDCLTRAKCLLNRCVLKIVFNKRNV